MPPSRRDTATIAWITYREDVTYALPRDTNRAISNYRTMNAELRAIDASGAYPQLQLWDLNDYTRFASGSWFTSDGVHQLRRGSWGVADWISRKMAHISRDCRARCRGGWPTPRSSPAPIRTSCVRCGAIPNSTRCTSSDRLKRSGVGPTGAVASRSVIDQRLLRNDLDGVKEALSKRARPAIVDDVGRCGTPRRTSARHRT